MDYQPELEVVPDTESTFYKEYLRYTTCVDLHEENLCGPRSLYEHAEQDEVKKVSVTNSDGRKKACVWRLFSSDEASPNRFLRYQFKLYPLMTINTKVVAFGQFMEPINFEDMFEQNEDYFTINAIDLNSSDIYVLAISLDSSQNKFRFEFDFYYAEDTGMSAGGVIAIIFLILLLLAAIGAVVALLLNRHGIVKFYLPKPIRRWCIKQLLPEEEEEAYGHDSNMKGRIDYNKELITKMAIQPGHAGFRIENDDFFTD